MQHSTLPLPDEQALSGKTKAALRDEIRQRIEGFTLASRQGEADCLNSTLLAMLAEANWESVLAFWADDHEPDLTPFLQAAAARGCRLAFPRLSDGGSLDFRTVESAQGPSERHPWGVRQPLPTAPRWRAARGEVLLLVPGVAFDASGGRLGRGKGFFDRYLANRPEQVFVLGVAWSVQMVKRVPFDDHDQRLDGLLLGGNSAILGPGVHLWH